MNNLYKSILHFCCCCYPKKLYIIDLDKDNSIHDTQYSNNNTHLDIKNMEDSLIKTNNLKKIETDDNIEEDDNNVINLEKLNESK